MQSIVLVDDSKAVTYIVKKFLEKEGYEVKAVHSAKSALKILEHHSADLIIADIMMPGMDGYELVRVLKADPKTARIPVIYFTAKGDVSDEFHGYLQGADDYVTKPVKKQDLLDKIEKVLKKVAGKGGNTQKILLKRNSLSEAKKAPPADSVADTRAESLEPRNSRAEPLPAHYKSDVSLEPVLEVINIFGSMLEVMWAFAFDKLLSFDDLSVIEQAIDRVCVDYPFMQHIEFSEDGIELDKFKVKISGEEPHEIIAAFSLLIRYFFEIILQRRGKIRGGEVFLGLGSASEDSLPFWEKILSQYGFSVQTCREPEVMAATAATARPDVVILLSGAFADEDEDLVVAFKERRELDSVPVFVIGKKDAQSVIRACKAGVYQYFSKELQTHCILTVLRFILKKRKSA